MHETNKLPLIILLFILFVSCNPSKNEVSASNNFDTKITQIDTVEKIITDVTNNGFLEELKQQEISLLPYSIGSSIELPNFENVDELELIWSKSQKKEAELNNLDKFFKFKNVKSLDDVLHEKVNLIESNYSSLFHNRFKPINDSIEVLLMSSNFTDSQVIIWFVLTFNIVEKKIIDNAIVGVFQTYFDTYYESYFRIEKDYTFKSIISSSYESVPLYKESDYRIEPNGKITRLLKQEYSYDNGDNLLSYRNLSDSYEIVFYEDNYDDGTPTFDLRYYKNNNSEYDSLLTIKGPISVFDNKNRKWLTVYKYKDISLWENSAHYKRCFYVNDMQIANVREVKYYNVNDSIMSIAFKNAKSDKALDEMQYIEFEYYLYGHTLFEPWSNSIFSLKSLEEVKTKLTYLK